MTSEEMAVEFISECEKESLENIFINPVFLNNLSTTDPQFVAPHLKRIHTTFQQPAVQHYLNARCKNAPQADVLNIMQKRTEYASRVKVALEKHLDSKAITDEDYVNALADLEIMHTIIKDAHAVKNNSLFSLQTLYNLRYIPFKYVAAGIIIGGIIVKIIVSKCKHQHPKPVTPALKNEATHTENI